ncbi:MAG: hypothetical protein JWL82_147 [Parcubacteria group bacterium]|nr:hypothetical protein [Parcubacteria group bacterium]
MKKIILIAAAVALLIAVGIVAWLVLGHKKTPQLSVPDAVTFPVDPTNSGGNGSFTTIPTTDGGSIKTKDLETDADVHEDPVNPGYFYLGYQDARTAPYLIEYIADTHYFNVELLTEPLGQNRIAAENYLMNKLGITKQEMCVLDYTLGTPRSVNEAYAGTNLGFSFCPDAVRLP